MISSLPAGTDREKLESLLSMFANFQVSQQLDEIPGLTTLILHRRFFGDSKEDSESPVMKYCLKPFTHSDQVKIDCWTRSFFSRFRSPKSRMTWRTLTSSLKMRRKSEFSYKFRCTISFAESDRGLKFWETYVLTVSVRSSFYMNQFSSAFYCTVVRHLFI